MIDKWVVNTSWGKLHFDGALDEREAIEYAEEYIKDSGHYGEAFSANPYNLLLHGDWEPV